MTFSVDFSMIQDTLRYCRNHCDSDEELFIVNWVAEKIDEACTAQLSKQIVAKVKP
jgi:hypothetical protein